MTKIKKNETFIPIKNYVLAALIVVVMLGATWYGFKWYEVIQDEKVSTSYLVKNKYISKEISNLDEVNTVFSETSDSYFIYVSYTGDENIYNMEKTLKNEIVKYNLIDNMYYLNVTDIKNNENYIDEVNKALNLEDRKITKVPTILYFYEGTLVEMTNPKGEALMTVSDFQKLIEISDIEE